MKIMFIGALPFKANEKWIETLISPFGAFEEIRLFADWDNPSHEPYALVKVKDIDLAMAELDGLKVGSTHLRVHEWRGNEY